MSDMGPCWLCRKVRRLTPEHIPPKSAFNSYPLLLTTMAERSFKTGRATWETYKREGGLAITALCERCNNRMGSVYGTEYVDFLREIAPRIDRAPVGATVTVDVRYPLRILKAVSQCFLAANGEAFATKQEWLRIFLQDRHDQRWPSHVSLYAYGCAVPGGRSTGFKASVDLERGGVRAVSEFSFWPFGAVLSFDDLRGLPLTPIHQWATYGFKDKGPVTLQLPVNVFATPFPLDFRNRGQVIREAGAHAGELPF